MWSSAGAKFLYRGTELQVALTMNARRFAICFLSFSLAAASFTGSTVAAGRVTWKLDDTAHLKLEDHIPRTWAVYRADKKKNLVLVLLVHRYLALDLKSRLIYEIDPKSLTPHGTDFESDEPDAIGHSIPTLEWNDRDVGPAERVQVRLGDYGKMLEIELPHPIDLRRGIY
ncbi:MAG: hypothetical protein WAN13_04160 [Candidatus Acidiferrales bacterium]